MIKYVRGDVTYPHVTGQGALLGHIVNNEGGWGKGVVKAISKRWPEPENEYRRWAALRKDGANPFALGRNQYVLVPTASERPLHVVNMLAQDGYQAWNRPRPLSYEALKECLDHLALTAQVDGASVHLPRIGCNLGGGSWAIVEKMIIEAFEKYPSSVDLIPVSVYDPVGGKFNH